MRMTPKRPCKPRKTVASLDELPAILTCSDVAVYLRLNPENVAAMAKTGVLNGAKQGRAWFFRKADVIDYENRLFGGKATVPSVSPKRNPPQRGNAETGNGSGEAYQAAHGCY